jgi:ribonuclease HI
MCFTMAGDVGREWVRELPMGTTLGELLEAAGGVPEGVKVIFPGASSTALVPSQLDTPLSFEHMAAVGSGLGAGGFAAYEERTCVVEPALLFLPVPPRGVVRPVPAVKLNSGDVCWSSWRRCSEGTRRRTSTRRWPGPGARRMGRSARSRPGRAAYAEPVPDFRGGVPKPRRPGVPLTSRAGPAEDRGLGRGSRPLHLRRAVCSQTPRLDLRVSGITQTPRLRQGLYTLHTDGGIVAEPGQPPGEGAIGAVLKNADNLLVEAISESIGHVDDHHVAEFTAFIEGLKMAKRHGVDKIRVFTDSELLVRGVHDEITLKSEELQALRTEAPKTISYLRGSPPELGTPRDEHRSRPPRRRRPPAPSVERIGGRAAGLGGLRPRMLLGQGGEFPDQFLVLDEGGLSKP